MTCEPYRILASAGADGELEANELIELGRHLEQCRECRQLYRIYHELDEGLEQLTVPVEILAEDTDDSKSVLLEAFRHKYRQPRLLERLALIFGRSAPFALATLAAVIILLGANTVMWRRLETSLDRRVAEASLDARLEVLSQLVSRSTPQSIAPTMPVGHGFDSLMESIDKSAWDRVMDDVDEARRHKKGGEAI